MEDITCPNFEETSEYGSRENSGSEEMDIAGFTTILSNLEGNISYNRFTNVNVSIKIATGK